MKFQKLGLLFVLLLCSSRLMAVTVTLAKSANKTLPKVLETVRYSMVVNATGATANSVVISDVVPAGLSVVAISPGGVNSSGTINWNLGNLSCVNQVVTMTVIADTQGAWGGFSDVNTSNDVWATSTLGGVVSSTNNWFYTQSLSGYSVNAVNSVRLYYEWRSNLAVDTITARFSNDGDLNTIEGSTVLTLGEGSGSDVIESWNITGLSTWNFNSLQFLAAYIQHDTGGGGGTHSAFMDRIWAVVDFQSCGTSVWYDAVVTNALVKNDIVNNTADASGGNFSTVTSNTASFTVDGPLLALTKTAQPTVAAQGDLVQYTLDYSNYVTGLSVYDDFADNWGKSAAIIPNWSAANANPENWENSGGKFWHTTCGYSPAWRDDTGNFADGTVSMDFLLRGNGSGNQNTSIMYLYQDSGVNLGKFYKTKLYAGCASPSGFCVDVQSGPAWNQVCGNAGLTTFNPAVWNNLKVVMRNYVFYVYVNDVLEFTCDDPTDYLTAPGKAGVYNDGDCTYYDNFQIGQDNPAFNVHLWDTLPACATYVGSTPSATVSGSLLDWNIGTLDAGQSGQIVYSVSFNNCTPGMIVPNTARISASNAQPNQGAAAVTVILPIQKSAAPANPQPSNTVTFSMVYTAPGGGTVVTDDHNDASFVGRWISQQGRYSSMNESAGTLNYLSNVDDEVTAVGTDGRDGAAQADILVKEGYRNGLLFGYQGGRYYYVAIYYGYSPGDDIYELHYFNGTTDTVLQSLGPMAIDPTDGSPTSTTFLTLRVVREGNRFRVYRNGVYVTTFVDAANNLPGNGLQGYVNHGGDYKFDNYSWTPGVKAGVSICDTLPAGMTYVSSCCTGNYAAGAVCWAVPDMNPGQSYTVSFLASLSATASGRVDNYVRAWHQSGVSYTAAASVTVSTSTINLLKSVGQSTYVFGQTVTYCMNWSVSGNLSTGVVIWDTINPILTYVGSSPVGTVAGSLISWNLGLQAPNATGQVCFWAVITAYPKNPFFDPETMQAWIRKGFYAWWKPDEARGS